MQKQLIFGKEKTQLPPEFTKARLAQQEREKLSEAAEAGNVKRPTSSDMHDVQSQPLSPGGKNQKNLKDSKLLVGPSSHNRSNSKLSQP